MTRLDGADISHHQDDAGPIDWPTLRAATWWVAAKATQSTSYTDPTFAAHWVQMGQGFTHRLAYHWLSPSTDPVAQANHFLAVWGRDGGAMLDAEQAGITAAMCLQFCEAVEQFTHRPVAIYTGAYVAGGTIWQSTALRTSKYGKRPFHLAAYTSEAKALALPGVKAYPWSAWQFSSNGPVPGITGRADMNRVDDRAAYDLCCGVLAAPIPLPVPEHDMALITNSEPHLFADGNTYPAGVVKWERGVVKRHIATEEEVLKIYGNVMGVALSNATLASIPDYASVDVDEIALAQALAPLMPKRFQGNASLGGPIDITAVS